MTDWWKGFFTPSVFPIAELMSPADTRVEVRELVRLLPRGARVLDAPCGIGRHSIPLARKGFEVVGVDQSKDYLAQARRAGSTARFVRGDLRDIFFDGVFDAVFNLWTSFGYFEDAADDLRALRCLRRALKPGGLLLLEVVDPASLRKHFEPKGRFPVGRSWVTETRRLREGNDPAVLAERVVVGPDGRRRRARSFVRLYDRRRLAAVLSRAGFERVTFRRGLVERVGRRSERILALARRPLDSGQGT